MKIRTMMLSTAATLGLGAAVWMAPHLSAQTMWDVIQVNLPYAVTLGDKTLPPGQYTIKQLQGDDNSPVLQIFNGSGQKFETAAMTVHTVDPDTPQKTSISLHHIGDSYYIDKIWVAGKNYGYEIPLPKNAREREIEAASVSVPAQNSTTSTTTSSDTTTTSTVTTADNSTATPPPPPPVPEPVMSTPAPEPAPAPQPQASPDTQQPPATPPPSDDNSANREKQPDSGNAPSMPATSAGWLAMLLSGGTLSSAGMILRRRKR
jgi:hypothetical protein